MKGIGTGIGTLFSSPGETSLGADDRRLSIQSSAHALHFLAALQPLNSQYNVPPIDDPLLGVACLLCISNLLCGTLLSSLDDEPSL